MLYMALLSKSRCDFCKKKCPIIIYKCKCGGKFCTKHRYSDSHNCKFDHTSLERERLKMHLPKVVKDKVNNRI